MRGKVFCQGCANLVMLLGRLPMCVATAEFLSGPLRRRIDVVGVVTAESRNRKNDCGYRVVVSLDAWKLKRWLLWRLNNDRITKGKIKQGKIEDYSVAGEAKRHKKAEREAEIQGAEETYVEKVVLVVEEDNGTESEE